MTTNTTNPLAILRDLGTPESLRQADASNLTLHVNSHIHLPPNFSAFETVTQAIDLAAAQGVNVLGVSNYYDYRVYGDFVVHAQAAGIFPLFGLEIISMIDDLRDAGVKTNDPGNPGKTYICGKGITRFTPESMTDAGQRLLDTIRANDAARMKQMIDKVEAIFAERGMPTGTEEATVIDMIVNRHGSERDSVYVQERHIAQAFCDALLGKTSEADRIEKLNAVLGATTKAKHVNDDVIIQGDIRSHLMKAGKPAFVAESFLSFADARQLILEMGGIPAYPVLADGASPICPYEQDVQALAADLKQRGIHAVELIPIRNAADVLTQYVTALRGAGMIVTAGTEHNTLDLIPLEPMCVGGVAIPDQVNAIFHEGACVVAAHQLLNLHGEVGYVDAAGNLNTEFNHDDDRIASLVKLGASAIDTYLRKNSA